MESNILSASRIKSYILKKFVVVLMILVGGIANAQVVFESTLADASAKAKQQNRPVFIEYYNSDCSVCKRLQKLLKSDKDVSEFYNSNYISYGINTYSDLSADETDLLASANLHFDNVPVLLYFDKDKNFLHYSTGDISAATVIGEANKAVMPTLNAAGLQLKYEAGDRSVRILYAYSNLLVVNKNQSELTKVTQQLFEVFNKEELPTKKSYLILKRVINSSDNGFFQYWINNLEKLVGFETAPHEGTELSYLTKIILTELSDSNLKSWDTSKKEKYKSYIKKLKITDNPEVFFE